MKMSKILIFAILALLTRLSEASTIVVDSFTEGPYNLSYGSDLNNTSAVSSPLGSSRFSRINDREAIAGAVVTSTLDDSLGTLNFAVDGLSSNAARPLDLRLAYSQGGPFSIVGYSAFEFDFSAVTGAGFLIIELGSATAVYGPTTNRINLGGPGVVTVPFSQLNFGTNGSINSFNSLHFTFEAATEEFSISMNEIRVVPEPSVIALVMPFLLTILLGRRRN